MCRLVGDTRSFEEDRESELFGITGYVSELRLSKDVVNELSDLEEM